MSIQIEAPLLPQAAQSRAHQPCHCCTELKRTFRFENDQLETRFVREQYRSPCYMRVATIFGIVQILIAPAFFYTPSLLAWPGYLSNQLFFISTLAYVCLCAFGGFVLTLFSRLPQTHRWWTAVGTSSTMLIFFAYFLLWYVYVWIFHGSYLVVEGQKTEAHLCNGTSMFEESTKFLADATSTQPDSLNW